jgi:dipeptidyl aminopeptidase/acylaminoacyl peptidase
MTASTSTAPMKKIISAFYIAAFGLSIAQHGPNTFAQASATATYKTAADIPVEVFFKREQYSKMTLSPNGRKLAALTVVNGRDNLSVIDLDAKKATVLTNYSQGDIAEFSWIDDSRMYYVVGDLKEASGQLRFHGRYAVDTDGTNIRDLREPTTRSQHQRGTANMFSIISRTYDGTGEVIVAMNERSYNFVDLYRYNTRTGAFKLLTFDSPCDVIQWVIDHDLVPRVAVCIEARKSPKLPRATTVWHRDGDGKPWGKISESTDPETKGSVRPLSFDYDNTTLYVSSRVGLDKSAIYKFDIANKKLGEKLLQHPMIDLNGGLMFSRAKKKLMGITYNADIPQTEWFDEDIAKLKARIDKTLPDTRNVISSTFDALNYMLIYASSDTDPGTYYLYNIEKGSIERIGKSRPWLPPNLMSERRFIKYKARDGLEIPAWVTIPKNSDGKNLPLIVHIHGGPWVRSYGGLGWSGDAIAQFFASRGYAVLEPEPRGSTGFGRKHYTSSFKQWGLAMQDDITDGALYLAAEGIVDKARMGLFGASYGGYATLQGLAKDPDIWRAGSAYVAVADLELMQTVMWSDFAQASDYLDTDYKKLVGDKDVDREQFQKTSPLKNADKFKAPVMLTMGADDRRVPLIHGDAMRDALVKAGKSIDYKVYPGEAHGFNKEENVFDFYKRNEKFFAEHLKAR